MVVIKENIGKLSPQHLCFGYTHVLPCRWTDSEATLLLGMDASVAHTQMSDKALVVGLVVKEGDSVS